MSGPLGPGARADASMSLVLAAAGAERRNRPRVLVILAVALLVAAGAFTLLSYKALTKARGAIAYQRDQTRTIGQLADEITAMNARESALIFAPDNSVAGKLEALGTLLQLEPAVVIEQRPGGSVPGALGVVRKLYNPRNTLKSIEIGPLVQWLAKACEIEGLVPTTIKIRALRTAPTDKPIGPGEADWELDAKFTRNERE